jgi:UTP--glucose-1-phosphate uridylyltransferase
VRSPRPSSPRPVSARDSCRHKAQPKRCCRWSTNPPSSTSSRGVRAGIDDILIITGRGKRTLEDHFDHNFELKYYLEQKGKTDDLDEIKALAEMADIHYMRQGSLGLGPQCRWPKHVGGNPFAVMLGDDIMDRRSTVLNEMISTYEQYGRSVVALSVPTQEISSYGCVGPRASPTVWCVLDIVEAPPGVKWPSWVATCSRLDLPVLEHCSRACGASPIDDAIAAAG